MKQRPMKFQANVTNRYTVTLPTTLCRELDIAVGDEVEVEVSIVQTGFRRTPTHPIPSPRGVLRDYFTDWDEINRFINEERHGPPEDVTFHEPVAQTPRNLTIMSQPDQDTDQATAYNPTHESQTCHAKVTGRHAVTLPAELCRRLNITTGDTVEFEFTGDGAILRRAPDVTTPPARGLLRDYFTSREEVQRFIEEERRGWEDDEEIEER